MSSRKRPRSYVTTKFASAKKRRRFIGKQPRRAYAGSMVPLRTGGYFPNRTEKKVNDVLTATYPVSTTGSFTLLANPSLGTDMNNRVGRKIVLKSFYIRGKIGTQQSVSLAATTSISQLMRMIIFADLQPNGAAPAVTDLLVEAKPASHLNLNNRDRFVVYCDKQWINDPYVSVTTATQSQFGASRQAFTIKKYKKINLEVIFNATNGGTIADINSGALFMFFIGEQAAGSTDGDAVVATRVRYADI